MASSSLWCLTRNGYNEPKVITLYSIIMPLKYHVFENIMKNGAFAFGANAPFSIIFSKVFKTLLKFFMIFYCLKIENDVMI